MGWPSLADLCTTTVKGRIGIAATYTPIATGVSASVTAPFDDPYYEQIVSDAGEPITVSAPAFDVQLADLLAHPAQGDRIKLVRPSTGILTTFRVEAIRLGGQGTAKLFLSVAS